MRAIRRMVSALPLFATSVTVEGTDWCSRYSRGGEKETPPVDFGTLAKLEEIQKPKDFRFAFVDIL